MIEIFRQWAFSIVSIGILFTIIKLIVPETNMKKYIYSIIGIVTVIAIFKPIIENKGKINIEKIALDVTDIISQGSEKYNYTDISNYEEINKNNVKEEFKKKLEKDMLEKLKNEEENNNISVNVKITKDYNIEEVDISYNGTNEENIKNIISTSYDISKEKIIINQGG